MSSFRYSFFFPYARTREIEEIWEAIEEIFGRRRRPILEEIEEILRFFAKKKVIEVRKNGPPEKIEENLRFFAKKRYWDGGN